MLTQARLLTQIISFNMAMSTPGRQGATPLTSRSTPRPGGRSARVQSAIHRAVRELQAESGRADLTVPAIAARAGVTPSTIYRRWGDLPQLLSDVAVENLRPDGEPPDTGSLRGDLQAWAEQYLDEIASRPGRALIRDVLAGPADENPGQCHGFTCGQVDILRGRALARGECAPSTEALMDRLVAPLVYRVLFSSTPPTSDYLRTLIDGVLGEPGVPAPR